MPLGRKMMPPIQIGPCRYFILLVVVAPLVGFPLFSSPESVRPSEPEEILKKALERANWLEMRNFESKYFFRVESTSEFLDEQGALRKSETAVSRSIPVGQYRFERLVEKDGRPLSAKEVQKEAVREQKFRSKVARAEVPEEEEYRVRFNEELVGRYDFRNEGTGKIDARDVHVLSFLPKAGPLPVNRRIDRALNQARGRIWIDCETFEVSRVTFVLNDPLKLGWGLIGVISNMEGRIERKAVQEGIWLPDRMVFQIKGRIFFNSFHRRMITTWSGFEPFPLSETASGR